MALTVRIIQWGITLVKEPHGTNKAVASVGKPEVSNQEARASSLNAPPISQGATAASRDQYYRSQRGMVSVKGQKIYINKLVVSIQTPVIWGCHIFLLFY